MRHSVSFLGKTVNVFWHRAALASHSAEWLRHYRDVVLPKGAHVWYKGDDGLWWYVKFDDHSQHLSHSVVHPLNAFVTVLIV